MLESAVPNLRYLQLNVFDVQRLTIKPQSHQSCISVDNGLCYSERILAESAAVMDIRQLAAQQLIQDDTAIRENFGIEVISAQEGSAVLHLTVVKAWVNAAGFTHGSVSYAMMDSACAYACASLDVLGLTTSGNVTYVRGSGAGARLCATAKVVSQSRRVMTFTSEVVDDQQRLLAHGSFVFQLVEKR